jgi:predicted nucleotidyltransferase
VTSSELQRQLVAFFEANPRDAVAVYLYGSMARGTGTAASDVDLAILYARAPQPTLEGLPLSLEAEIERLVGRPVQVIVLNGAPSDLVHRVLRDGKLLLDRDRPARIRFEVQARNEFFDLEPIRRQYRKLAPAGRR